MLFIIVLLAQQISKGAPPVFVFKFFDFGLLSAPRVRVVHPIDRKDVHGVFNLPDISSSTVWRRAARTKSYILADSLAQVVALAYVQNFSSIDPIIIKCFY